jgi:hypothetical protein
MIRKSIALLVLAAGVCAMAVEASAETGSAGPRYFAEISPFQLKMIDKWVNPDEAPAELRAAVTEAAPTIKTLLAEASCKSNYDSKTRSISPDELTPYNDAGPMAELPDGQHRETVCLTVDKITHWNLVGPDTVGFEVLYRSPDTLRTVTKRYAAARQPEGKWRIDYATKQQTAQKK